MTCDNQIKLKFPVLVGDIGGTNARFAILLQDSNQDFIVKEFLVNDYNNINQALESFLSTVKVKPLSMILAIAAPVEGRYMRLTNSHWFIDIDSLLGNFSFEKILLINDFEAQALASSALSNDDLYILANGNSRRDATRLIIGPGTGLGVAALLHTNGKYIPIPGEGGHIDYAPQSANDFALYPYLKSGICNRFRAEDLLSGKGLELIYQSLSRKIGKAGPYKDAQEIAIALQHQDVIAQETLDFFLCYLARICGDFALTFKAEGGVYLGGGILPKMLDFIDKKAFYKTFCNKFPHENLLKNIPIYIMTHPYAALKGMEALARHSEKYLINDKDSLFCP